VGSEEAFVELSQLAEVIELPSNSGLSRLRFIGRGASDDRFLTDVNLLKDGVDEPEGVEVLLRALPISRARLHELSRELAEWFPGAEPVEASLIEERWAEFRLVIGAPSPGDTTKKPVCSVNAKWHGVFVSAGFVVDQSCLRLFHEGVDGWLRLRIPQEE
jgi:hypothetical protein